MLSTTTVQYIKSETETYRAISVLYSRELDGCSLKTILNSFSRALYKHIKKNIQICNLKYLDFFLHLIIVYGKIYHILKKSYRLTCWSSSLFNTCSPLSGSQFSKKQNFTEHGIMSYSFIVTT